MKKDYTVLLVLKKPAEAVRMLSEHEYPLVDK